MDKYFYSFREMISLRGLTDHTLKSYCTYIHSYLDYPTFFINYRKTLPGMSCVPISVGFKKNGIFPTALLIMPFHSCGSLPCMFFINRGTTPSSLCGNLTLICLMSHLYRKYIPFLTRFLLWNRKQWLLLCILPVCGLGKSADWNILISSVPLCAFT